MEDLKLKIRSLLGIYPQLFYPIYGLKPQNIETFTSKTTEIVIEGFPRSANSFAVVTFRASQPKHIKIAHHHHVPAQIIRGVQLKIPTIVLIRSPKDAIASYILYHDKHLAISQAIQQYILFYQPILPYQSGYITASFEQVIKDYATVIERVNQKFETKFIAQTPEDDNLKDILAITATPAKGKMLENPTPSASRTLLKQDIFKKLESPKYRKLLDKAENLYKIFIALT